MQQDEAVQDACCLGRCVSLVCAEETWDLAFHCEGTQGNRLREADNAANEACTADGTVRPAFGGRTAGSGDEVADGAVGDDDGC